MRLQGKKTDAGVNRRPSSYPTYSNRILGGLSEAIKGCFEKYAHQATIRAFVIKRAKNCDQPLGPRWKAWHPRSLQGLIENGILQKVKRRGYISMTPQARKVVSSALQVLPPNPTPAQEDRVWKKVEKEFRAAKRPRVESDDEEEEEEEGVRSALLDKPATGQVHKPKAPSQEILRTERQLRARLLEATRRAGRETEERKRLEQMLRAANEELGRLREVDGRTAVDTIDYAPASPPQQARTKSPDIAPAPSLNGMRARRVLSATRTESRSVIPFISRRPTPAPSDADSDDDCDVFMGEEAPRACSPVVPFRVIPFQGLPTPEASPIKGHNQSLQNKNATLTACHSVQVSDNSISELERDLQSERSKSQAFYDRIVDLERQIDHLKSQVSECANSISARDAKIMNLTDINNKHESDLEQTRDKASGLEDTVRNLETVLEDKKRELQKQSDDMNSHVAAATKLEKNLHDQITGLENKLKDVREEKRTLAVRLLTMEEQFDASEIRGAELDSVCASSAKEASNLRANISSVEEELNMAEKYIKEIEEAKKADEVTLADVIKCYNEVKNTWFSENDRKINSAQPSPMPKRRTRLRTFVQALMSEII